MSRYMNESFRSLEAYVPGEQPKDMKYIKLNTNESPYAPSDGVLEAVRGEQAENLNLYPDPQCAELKEAIATLYGVQKDNVFVSNGSDDILNFFFMAFCNGDSHPVKFPDISYGFYEVFAQLYGVKYTKVPLLSDFTVNIEDYFGNDSNVVIANPNAPTGIALGRKEIQQILEKNPDRVVVVDEAYVDFGGESCVELTQRYDNLLVVCTYSKSRSMAGARLGFAIANKEIIADLEKIKFSTNPYSINRLTMAAGIAAINDNDYYMDNCKKIVDTRQNTVKELEKLGFEVLPSSANFIFAKNDGIDGEELYLKLRQRGILVRHFSAAQICQYNRITIGTPQQMSALIEQISNILKERKL